jgi:hypothetical protein
MQRYILGGGIAGLITAFYNQDCIIISDNIGGQMADTGLGPRILEANEFSTTLLNDLGYENIPTKTAKVGYMVWGQYLDSLTEELKLEYYKKSRYLSELKEAPKSVMSDGKKEIVYYDIDWNDLINRLIGRIEQEPILGKIEDIDVINQVITIAGMGEFKYSKLINTLPAPLFFNRLAKIPPEEKLTYVPKTFIITDPFFNMKDFDYVYFPGDEVNYHRVTKLNSGKVAVEYTIPEHKHDVLEDWPDAEAKTIPAGQIQSGKPGYIENVYYIGRFGCWDHDLKTDDIVAQAKLLWEIGGEN